MDTISDRDNNACGTTIENIACGYHFTARLEPLFDVRQCTLFAVLSAEDGENRADGTQTINVGGTIEGVESDNIFPLKTSKQN